MSPRSRLSHSVRASLAQRLFAAWITLTLIACSPAVSGPATPSRQALGLPASSSGVCEAIAALPDLPAAERAFINVAHGALHGLAADPRLDRSRSGRVLEAMAKVEADFRQPPDVSVLTSDLAVLQADADAALQALGMEVPACAN